MRAGQDRYLGSSGDPEISMALGSRVRGLSSQQNGLLSEILGRQCEKRPSKRERVSLLTQYASHRWAIKPYT